jgi:hypothetical protein
VDLSGQVDGADLVEMSFAYQNNIVAQSNWGQYFFPNPRYVEVADLVGEEGAGDVDGKVDGKDADWLVQSIMEPGAAVPDGR